MYISQWLYNDCTWGPFKVGTLGPHTVLRSLLIAAHTHSTFSGVLLVQAFLWITFNCGSPSLKCLCHTFICTALTASSPKAVWIIWIVSTEECSILMQNLVQIRCSTHLVILNVTATQYTCSFNGIYCLHWLVQWSHHWCMCVPVFPPWLPSYIDVMQTILIY